MPHGYSQYTIAANKGASKRSLGVALGRVCIAKNISVAAVAKRFNVSRQTVYSWFEGRHEPSQRVLKDLMAFIDSLAKK